MSRSELEMWARYLSEYPAPLERIERQLALLSSQFYNTHQRGKGSPALKPADCVLFRPPAAKVRSQLESAGKKGRYSELDRALMNALLGAK